MLTLLAPAALRELPRFFSELCYDSAGLIAAFDLDAPPNRAALPRFLHLTRGAHALPPARR